MVRGVSTGSKLAATTGGHGAWNASRPGSKLATTTGGQITQEPDGQEKGQVEMEAEDTTIGH